jgi:WD40-like Beta Propeller Repeat
MKQNNMVNKTGPVLFIAIIIFTLLLNSCASQNEETVIEEITPTITHKPSTATPIQPQKTELVEPSEPTLPAPPPGFPIELPGSKYVLSADNQKIAVVSFGEDTEEGLTLRNILVNDIPIKTDWKSLLPPDEYLTISPSLSFSPSGQYLAVSVIERPTVDQKGTIWIFRTSDWERCATFYFDMWYRPVVWAQNEQTVAFRSMEIKVNPEADPKYSPLLLSDDDFISLLGINGEVSSFLSPSDVFPEREDITPPQVIYCQFGPAWSPDGRHIAYLAMMPGNWQEPGRSSENIITGGSGNFQLVLIDTLSSMKEIAYEGNLGMDPVWSPDGKKILFDSTFKLQIFDLETNTMKTVFSSNQLPSNPLYSPSGEPKIYAFPLWTPNSQSVIFFTDKGYYMVDVNTGNLKELDLQNQEPIQFSADGNWLIYEEDGMLKLLSIDSF